ncbi:hypothetical protein RD792_017368 [Penstemon davidsonii]|uniref:Bifunctional inhibitor/plant lipid transfer protein/seed storage helical domain-containing protein n=1 Tax=Penstemon davidsonii TaxID=160366 RepID=A0ABR0CP74_9LAMI|nr:hypothetical protein RD792_017368 [Penstemon davidsonii]
MEKSPNFPGLGLAFVIALTIIVVPVNGQSSSLCTGPMMRIVTPCISFLASGSNVSSPSSDCCSSIKDLMSNGQDCLCLIVTGGAPFEVPINRTLAISLPRACRMSGVPIECKASAASPIPSPDSRNQGQNGPNNLFPGLFPPPTGPFINPQPSPPSFTPGGGGRTPFVPDPVPEIAPPVAEVPGLTDLPPSRGMSKLIPPDSPRDDSFVPLPPKVNEIPLNSTDDDSSIGDSEPQISISPLPKLSIPERWNHMTSDCANAKKMVNPRILLIVAIYAYIA